MLKAERRETLVGVAALAVAAAGLVLTALGNRINEKAQDAAASYTAEFSRADGLHTGAPVRLAGVRIGSVGDVKLDAGYRAIMTLILTQDIPLPDDTAAIIETDGVFGSKYIELQPGGSLDMLKPGGRIGYTQDSVIIEELITKIVEQAKAATKAKPATDGNTP
jgi:phospholipid/cholesterol/gamma-HCH transport system substrate-binding protein